MYTIADIMTSDPVTLSETDDLVHAHDIFYLGRLRHLPVVAGERLVGLVTHRDYLRAIGGSGREAGMAVAAAEVMTREVDTVTPLTPLRDALALMMRNKYGCVPVVDENQRLVGIVTDTDVVQFAHGVIDDLDRIEEGMLSAAGLQPDPGATDGISGGR